MYTPTVTLTKLKKSLDHGYVKNVAEYLILRIEEGEHVEVTIHNKPFEEKIERLSLGFTEELCGQYNPDLKVTAACYTSKRHLSGVLEDLLD
jgi:hypothetical protein